MMRDCDNVEMRDLLPDLLHSRLGPAERDAVERHVASCVDCTAELALLRSAQASLRGAPVVDVVRIVAALPRAGARRRRSRFPDWRMAAGVAAVLLGAVGIRVARQPGASDGQRAGPVAVVNAPAARNPAPATGTAAEPLAAGTPPIEGAPHSARATAPALTPAGGLADLSDHDLELLLGRFDGLTGVPDAEPDAEVAPVTLDEGVS